MTNKTIEIFSAGCPLCTPLVTLVTEIVGDSANVTILDTRMESNIERARAIGVRTVPAVAIDGKLASCCITGGYNENELRRALT